MLKGKLVAQIFVNIVGYNVFRAITGHNNLYVVKVHEN